MRPSGPSLRRRCGRVGHDSRTSTIKTRDTSQPRRHGVTARALREQQRRDRGDDHKQHEDEHESGNRFTSHGADLTLSSASVLARWIVAYVVLVLVAIVAEVTVGGEIGNATRYLLIAAVPTLALEVRLYASTRRGLVEAERERELTISQISGRRLPPGDR